MNSHFFLICFGVLGSYAVLRTMRRGWLRVLFVFFLVLCLVKVAFDQIFPMPVYVAQANTPSPVGASSGNSTSTSVDIGGVHRFLVGLSNDRCIMSHLQDTPLSPIAYMIQAHNFLQSYQQAQAGTIATGGASIGAVSQAVSATFQDAPQKNQPVTLCEKFDEWMQAQAQAGIQNVVSTPDEQ